MFVFSLAFMALAKLMELLWGKYVAYIDSQIIEDENGTIIHSPINDWMQF